MISLRTPSRGAARAPGWRSRRRLTAAIVGLLVLLATGLAIAHLRSEAGQRRADARALQLVRDDVADATAIAWQGIAQGGPDFSLARDQVAVRSRLRRDVRTMRGPHTSRIGALVAELDHGLAAERRELDARRVGDARAALVTVLWSTSDLLSAELHAAGGEATRAAARADARANNGSFAVLGLAALLICLVAWHARRGDRRAERAERAALERSEARFRSMVEQSTEMIFVVDRHGVVLDVTEAALASVLGWDAAEVRGRRLEELVPADQRAEVPAAVLRAISGTRGRPPSEWTVLRSDGREVHLEAMSNNLLDTATVGGIVITARDVTERRRAEAALRHQAFHDGLTGLPNRVLFEDRLNQAVQRGHRAPDTVAVVFVDLDDFKLVNDTLGHAAGDALLLEVARRLDGSVRAGDTASRLGGDEFAVLVEGREAASTAAVVARRLQEELAQPVVVGGRPIHVRASIGIAPLGDGGADGAALLRNADLAMYEAKAAGKGRIAHFGDELLDAARDRLHLREALRHAVERGELSLHYQPVLPLAGDGPRGVEALLRWTHPAHGPISPVRFIPVAEESGLIVPIGRWVLERACADARRLEALDAELGVGVNVSVVQLREPGFQADVEAALHASGLPPERLVLEITESVVAAEADVVATLEALRATGVRLAVDDFGTGYSSLSYLRDLDVDSVKIDRSFVDPIDQAPRAASVVRSIVELAHTLGLSVVAEGVEREGQIDALHAASCDFAQGYLLGRPAPVGELIAGRVPSRARG